MSGSRLPLSDDSHRFMHDDGYYYEYPQTSSDVERRKKSYAESRKFQGAGYERRKKQRAESRDETYDPENDPEVIERRRATAEKEKEQRRKEIAEGKRTKKPANRGKHPPRSVISNAPLVISDPPQEVAQEVQGAAQEVQGAQTAKVERGGALPPRRQGSGSRASRDAQAQENAEAQEIGPLRVTKPTRDANYARRVSSYKGKLAVVRKQREEDPHKFQKLSTDDWLWNFFQQDYYETVIFPRK